MARLSKSVKLGQEGSKTLKSSKRPNRLSQTCFRHLASTHLRSPKSFKTGLQSRVTSARSSKQPRSAKSSQIVKTAKPSRPNVLLSTDFKSLEVTKTWSNTTAGFQNGSHVKHLQKYGQKLKLADVSEGTYVFQAILDHFESPTAHAAAQNTRRPPAAAVHVCQNSTFVRNAPKRKRLRQNVRL